MNGYRVIYGVGDVCGCYNQAMVVASKEEHIRWMLNEQEGEDVLISLIEVTTEDATVYKNEQVLSVEIA